MTNKFIITTKDTKGNYFESDELVHFAIKLANPSLLRITLYEIFNEDTDEKRVIMEAVRTDIRDDFMIKQYFNPW